MRYISTRGAIAPISFKAAVMMGLADDGGLLLPETLPAVDSRTLESWRELSFPELALAVMSPFISDIPAADLKNLIDRSYRGFTHREVTPVVKIGPIHVLELFHGPTLAFKDVALQLLGNLFEYILAETGGRMNILGATSGDTGSAAIHGVRGKARINIFILHPFQRVSPIQELQMTTVEDANVFNLAIRGTFDDGQAIVKAIFNDLDFKTRYHLGAINSINWARVLAQVVYYIYAWLRVTATTGAGSVDFAVPTGNFGDIFAGFVARAMLPAGCIRRLILATNENDLLARFINQGEYARGRVVATSSPSMDIQVASNFERYLYYLRGCDPDRTRRDMVEFGRSGRLDFSGMLGRIQQDFAARAVSEPETAATIKEFHAAHGYLLDPHTAVGVKAAMALTEPGDPVPKICLATAHPAKFGAAVAAAIGSEPALPPALSALAGKPTRCTVMGPDQAAVQAFIERNGL